jgi:hypothetical protein
MTAERYSIKRHHQGKALDESEIIGLLLLPGQPEETALTSSIHAEKQKIDFPSERQDPIHTFMAFFKAKTIKNGSVKKNPKLTIPN